MKVALAGNPNAGKSVLFNLLTGGNARVGNWHGVTVVPSMGRAKWEKEVEIYDLPGIYSFNPLSGEEECAIDFLQKEDCFVLFVAECRLLPRNLSLIRSIFRGRKGGIVLTKYREFSRLGGRVDERELSSSLGLPVLVLKSLSSREEKRFSDEVKKLLSRLSDDHVSRLSSRARKEEYHVSGDDGYIQKEGDHASDADFPSEKLYGYLPPRERSGKGEKLFYSPILSFLFFACFFLFAFWMTFGKWGAGDWAKKWIEGGISILSERSEGIPYPVLKSFIQTGVLSGLCAVLSFLPQIALLFFFSLLLEESGLLARLAFLSDGFLSKFGLSGRAVFSLLMGFGCTAVAIVTTRGLEERKMQKRAIFALPYLSCSAKLPVFLTIGSSFFADPFPFVLLLYLVGLLLSLLALRCTGENPPDFIMEYPPLTLPNGKLLLKSLLFQIKGFIIKTATVVFVFFLASWLLSSFDFRFQLCGVEESMLACLCKPFGFLFAPIGCGDWRMTYTALSGLVAKENVAGLLSVFYGGFPFSVETGLAFSAFLLTCSPCVSAISATAAQLGRRRAAEYFAFQTVSSLLFSYAVYPLAKLGAWAICAAILLILLLIRINPREKVRRFGRNHLKKIYR